MSVVGGGELQMLEFLQNHLSIPNSYSSLYRTKIDLENHVWYNGVEDNLRYFYRNQVALFHRNGVIPKEFEYFWRIAHNMNMKHTGIPQLISQTMPRLLLGSGYKFSVEEEDEPIEETQIIEEDATEVVQEESELQEMLDDILGANDFDTMLNKAVETESWSGGVAFKVIMDTSFSPYPILQFVDQTKYTYRAKYGRIVEDVFTSYYTKDKYDYKLYERYGVDPKADDDVGGAYIRYELLKCKNNKSSNSYIESDWKVCQLKELEETQDYEDVRIDGYMRNLAWYKQNLTSNNKIECLLGASDYAGSIPHFDSLDEVYSTWIQDIREGRMITYVPSKMLERDANANGIKDNPWNRQIETYPASKEQGADNKITSEQPDVAVERYDVTYKKVIMTVLNNAGLAPQTIGITGLESIDASAESQQEREKTSIRTRNTKLQLWTELLEEMLPTLIDVKAIMDTAKEEDGEVKVTLPETKDVVVSFNDYIIKSRQDRVDEMLPILGALVDLDTALKVIWENELTDVEIATMEANIIAFQGITTPPEKPVNEPSPKEAEKLAKEFTENV